MLRRGHESLLRRDYEAAEVAFIRCLNYHFLSEAISGLALCKLYRGGARAALSLLESSIKIALESSDLADPDPVEWAWFVVGLLCQGDVKEARRRASQFPGLYHTELERCRAIVAILCSAHEGRQNFGAGGRTCRRSIHSLPERDMQGWVREIVTMLTACGQTRFADRLRKPRWKDHDRCSRLPTARVARREKRTAGPAGPVLPLVPERVHLKTARWLMRLDANKRVLRSAAVWAAKRGVLLRASRSVPVLRRLRKLDEFCRSIEASASKESAQTALLISHSHPSFCADAFVDGLHKNPCMPVLFVATSVNGRYENFVEKYICKCVSVASSREKISELKYKNKLQNFDLIFVDGELRNELAEWDDLFDAKLIYVNGTDNYCNSVLVRNLMTREAYSLVVHNPRHRAGYAIFRKSGRVQRRLVPRSDEPAPQRIHSELIP